MDELELEYKEHEEKLYKDGFELLSNGHRMTYVFKYIRDRATDDEMRGRIMERLTATNEVKEIHNTRLEEHGKSYQMSWMELGGGIAVIAFAAYMTRILWDSGWVSTLPLGLVAFVLIMWTRKR